MLISFVIILFPPYEMLLYVSRRVDAVERGGRKNRAGCAFDLGKARFERAAMLEEAFLVLIAEALMQVKWALYGLDDPEEGDIFRLVPERHTAPRATLRNDEPVPDKIEKNLRQEFVGNTDDFSDLPRGNAAVGILLQIYECSQRVVSFPAQHFSTVYMEL
jgi:hypothetical protein